MSALDEAQRAHVREIVSSQLESTELSGTQRWQVFKDVLPLFLALFGVLGGAGYFLIENLATRAAADVSAVDVAEKLEQRDSFFQILSKKTTLIPTGTVAAFAIPSGCPEGWEDFAQARGRVIVGATSKDLPSNGLSHRKYFEEGGVESHVLTFDEMPIHGHSQYNPVEAGSSPIGDELTIFDSVQDETGDAGGNSSHENMPPFLALYWCKKGPHI